MAAPIITPIPTPPIRSDAPADFAVKADNFAAALPGLVTETNASVAFVDQRAIDADTSASAAAASAGTANAKAGEASQSATAAQTYAANLESLDELWLGAATSDPATGKAGAPLVAGNAYVNSATGYLRAFNGSEWVQGVSAVAGVSSINGLTGAVDGVVTEAGGQTLSNKTLGPYFALSESASTTLDLASSQVFRIAVTSNRAITFANPPPTSRAMTVVVHLYNTSLASRTITWPAGINWNGGEIPAPSGTKMTIVLFWTGSEWIGSVGAES